MARSHLASPAAMNWSIDHLRAVGEVAELRLPQDQGLRVGRATSHIRSRARRIRRAGCRGPRSGPGRPWSAGYICAPSFWSTQTAWRWLNVPRPLSWPDRRTGWSSRSRVPKASASAGRPVEALAALEHLALGVDDPAERLVDGEVRRGPWSGSCRSRATVSSATPVATLRRSVIAVVRLAEARPGALEPVGLVGQIGFGRLELALEQGGEGGDLAVDPALGRSRPRCSSRSA